MKIKRLLGILLFTVLFIGCTPVENDSSSSPVSSVDSSETYLLQ